MNMEHNKLRAYKRVHYYRQEINGYNKTVLSKRIS